MTKEINCSFPPTDEKDYSGPEYQVGTTEYKKRLAMILSKEGFKRIKYQPKKLSDEIKILAAEYYELISKGNNCSIAEKQRCLQLLEKVICPHKIEQEDLEK